MRPKPGDVRPDQLAEKMVARVLAALVEYLAEDGRLFVRLPRTETEPSSSVSTKIVSPALSPELWTQRFGNETRYVEPPAS